MTGNEGHFIAQGPKFAGDGADEIAVIAAWKVGSADGTEKQDVAHHGEARAGVVQHYMSWGVPRGMNHVQNLCAHGDLVAIVEPSSGGEGFAMRHSVTLTVNTQVFDEEKIIFMRPLDRNAESLRQIVGGPGMIQMSVSNENLFEGDTILVGGGQNTVRFAAGINHGAPQRLRAPDDGTVLPTCNPSSHSARRMSCGRQKSIHHRAFGGVELEVENRQVFLHVGGRTSTR
jgi:hypothetical protein